MSPLAMYDMDMCSARAGGLHFRNCLGQGGDAGWGVAAHICGEATGCGVGLARGQVDLGGGVMFFPPLANPPPPPSLSKGSFVEGTP